MTERFVEIPGQLTEAVAELSTLSFWQRGGTIAALTGLSAVGLVACGDAQPSQPIDTRPAVASNALINADPALNEIDLGELSTPLATAENNHELPPPNYYGLGTSVGDQFPVTPSMPLFKVVLGTDNTLRVEDQTHGYEALGTPAEQLLLGAVQQDSTLITGLMKARSLDSIEFRVFDPAQSDTAAQTNQSFPEFVPEDSADHKRNDIYDFLPAAGSMDQHSLALMLQHESLHAAFKQGEPGGHLSSSEKVLVGNACTTLRNAALQQAKQYGGSILEDLAFMHENLAPQYKPYVQKVIDAFQNGTYAQLPGPAFEVRDVPSCTLNTPVELITNMARLDGISTDAFANAASQDDVLGRAIADSVDGWNHMIEQDTLYQTLREGTYLGGSGDDESMGHPADNSDETEVSLLNVALSYPGVMAANMHALADNEQQAVDTIVKVGVTHLEALYADQPALITMFRQHYNAYLAARKK